ncbi:fumarylacetoacetate (FAA) hydrolase [Rubrobacter xylanophilus DSM 9941]|uniref:Fumarylacetoacetate (FAA) hydrolase n=1 Tax=Rubrobacter xylanophilus (strain DSM 9941 / JCM 11954 / NBRC 16129 / PRD-1) TaxID=266117 RepID=Q1ATV1_RUBXD|nr:fumarylacetoacetate hydrolase family protein [Rubrobacter xylanophilus]ABG05177.1 fumarylacetoacetate (FAA) hydrolase [Rubrobacter xylanophilus DSM 9941]
MRSEDSPRGWFALGTFEHGGLAFPGLVLEGGRVVDLSRTEVPGASVASFRSVRQILEGWEANRAALAAFARHGAADAHDLADLRVLPPVEPVQILQSGANYHRHVVDLIVAEARAGNPRMTPEEEAEVRRAGERLMDERAERGEPYLFLGSPTALCGPYDDVVLPAEGDQHDWELEFAAVIGRSGRHVPPERALDLVAGYTIANDITTRDLVYRPDLKAIGTDWLRSKNAPTFLPTGPYIVPKEFVGDTSGLRITLRLNGETMQDESASDMIFDVARLVSYASSRVLLRPGDLILTGSPAGNGSYWGRFLGEGDVMEGTVTGLGYQRNRCVRERLPEAAPGRVPDGSAT